MVKKKTFPLSCQGAPPSMSGRRTLYFVIEGPLMGYRQSTRKSFWTKRNQDYARWKEAVYLQACAAGLRDEDRKTCRENVPVLAVTIWWRKGPRMDWKNVVGGIEDAIFPEDRWVMPGKMMWVPDSGEEKAEVWVKLLQGRWRMPLLEFYSPSGPRRDPKKALLSVPETWWALRSKTWGGVLMAAFRYAVAWDRQFRQMRCAAPGRYRVIFNWLRDCVGQEVSHKR